MAPFFSDTFTEPTTDTALDAHTPDVGTSWTQLFQDASGPVINALAASDNAAGTTVADKGVIYTADATYPSADYDVTFTLQALSTTSSRKLYVLARVQDVENMYAVQLNGNAANICRLYKKVAGTWTALGSAFAPPAAGSVCKLEIIGTALAFYDDGVSVASATDSDISAAGKAGLASGGGAELVTSTDDSNAFTTIDTLTVTDLGAAGLTDAGAAIAGQLSAGADQQAGIDAGNGLAGAVVSGADAATLLDSGYAVWGGEVSGADVYTPDSGGTAYTETGFAVWGLVSAGADLLTGIDAGAGVVGSVTTGADVGVGVDLSDVVLGWIVSGTDTQAQSDSGYAVWGNVASGDAPSATDPNPAHYPVYVRQHGSRVGQTDNAVRQQARKVR